MICHGTARNPEHLTCNCPILKNLGYKLEKQSGSDIPAHYAASRAATDAGLATAGTVPVPDPAPPAESQPGSSSAPGAFSASTEHESYDSGDKFDYEGKADGAMYDTGGKTNASSAYSTPSCRIASVEPESGSAAATVQASTATPGSVTGGPTHSMGGSTLQKDPRGVNTVYLPKTVLVLLKNPPSQAIVPSPHPVNQTSLLVADSGATDHMLPDKSVFISYHPVSGRRVRMGNNSFAPILGHGTAVISLNGKKILIRDCLHVP